MGKRRRKQNEELDKDNVSLDKNKGTKLSKTLSTSNIAVFNEVCTDIKRTKSENRMYNKDKLDKMPVDNEKDKSNENTTKQVKKKKQKVQEQEIVNIVSHEGKSIDDNKKTRKKRKEVEVQDVLVNEKKNSPESQPVSVKFSKKKRKICISHNDEDSQNKINIGVSSKDKKQNINNKEDKKKNKNIHEEVVEIEKTNNDNESKKTKKKRMRKVIEEEVINDEDIDKYCDEIDPSYNKQYEDWVKLIEANLNSNKKAKQ